MYFISNPSLGEKELYKAPAQGQRSRVSYLRKAIFSQHPLRR